MKRSKFTEGRMAFVFRQAAEGPLYRQWRCRAKQSYCAVMWNEVDVTLSPFESTPQTVLPHRRERQFNGTVRVSLGG